MNIPEQLERIEKRLQELRLEYKQFPEKRGKIMLQVRPLLSALSIYKRNHS